MGLGSYTAQRAHEFTRLAVASGVKNPEQNVHVGDRRARGMKGMSVSRRSFEVSVRPAGVLEPRWGGCWGVVTQPPLFHSWGCVLSLDFL